MKNPNPINNYILQYDEPVQKRLKKIRSIIRKAVPGVTESITYRIPTFKLDGVTVIFFAAFKKHIGLYPVPVGVKKFQKAFKNYKTSGKGTVQLPLDEPLPISLVEDVVKYRLKEAKRILKERKTKKRLVSR